MSEPLSDAQARVAVVMGSKSDYEVMKECAAILKQFHGPHEVGGIPAHRTAEPAREFALGAESRGIRIINAAG
jgi:phosphoribosylcarboxyaminoimidazole (NCAIR) mutase